MSQVVWGADVGCPVPVEDVAWEKVAEEQGAAAAVVADVLGGGDGGTSKGERETRRCQQAWQG